MRFVHGAAFLALIAGVSAIPITPAAPEHQARVELMRAEGLAEHEIAEQLSLPNPVGIDGQNDESRPIIEQINAKLHSLLDINHNPNTRDISGDIPPGSLEAPQMLPRAAAPISFGERVKALLRGESLRRTEYAYEGKELAVRHPTGMRHWGLNGQWEYAT